MKMQKPAALLIAMVMVAVLTALTVPASAECCDDAEHTGGIALYYDLCMECGGMRKMPPVKWSEDWTIIREIKCSHYAYGFDLVWENCGIRTIQCISCKHGCTVLESRTKTDCRGSKS